MIPKTIDGVINWAEAHKETFEQNLVVLQLTQADIDDFASLIDDCRAFRAAATSAKEASKSATASQNDAIAELRTMIGGLVTKITGTAKTSDNPKSIYNAADLPTPKTPSDLEAPPAPVNVIATFNNTNGTVEMKWSNPSKDAFIGKTTFIIERQLAQPISGSGLPVVDWVQVGQSATKQFADDSVPSGYGLALYRITATRNNFNSVPSEPAMIIFGNVMSSGNEASGGGESSMAEAA